MPWNLLSHWWKCHVGMFLQETLEKGLREKTSTGSGCFVFKSSVSKFQACNSIRKSRGWLNTSRYSTALKILHGFEIRIGAQEWKTCQASTSGNADHVCILLFYLLLCRTFSPHKQDCITQGGGKDQFLPFLNLPLCRFR